MKKSKENDWEVLGLFTYEEASNALRMSRRRLQDHVREGEIAYVMQGRKKLFRKSDLEVFVESKIVKGGVA